jgi:hypothetical protein
MGVAWLSFTLTVCVEAVVFTKTMAFTQVAVVVTAVEVVGSVVMPLSKEVVPQAVFGTTDKVPLTGCVTALPSIFKALAAVTAAVLAPCEILASHGVVFEVLPG